MFPEKPAKPKGTGKGKKTSEKRKVTEVDGSDTEDDAISLHDSSDDENDGSNDAECLLCGCLYSEDKHGEQWRQCMKCFRWAHEDCGADDLFICPQCTKQMNKKRKSQQLFYYYFIQVIK